MIVTVSGQFGTRQKIKQKVNLRLMPPINQIGVLVTPVRKANYVLGLSLG